VCYRRLPKPPPRNTAISQGDAAFFLTQRLQTLASTGNVETAQNLLNTIPRKEYTLNLWQMAVSLSLLEGKIQQACILHQTALEKTPDTTNTAKMIFFCQLAEGNRAGAELTLSVMREQANRNKVADTFIDLAAFGLEQSTTVPTLENPSLKQIALLSLIQKDVPLQIHPAMNPTLFPRLATLPFLWSGTRIVAAEQAVSRNTLDVATLLHLYRSEKFNENEWGTIDDTQALGKVAMDDPLPTGRENALLWQKIQRTKTLDEKLQLLNKLMPLNAEKRTMVAFAKVFYPLLQETPISKQFLSYAPNIVPLLVLAGDEDRAGVWFNFLEIEARGNNTTAIDVLATLWPYYALQRRYALDMTIPLNVLLFKGWQQKNPTFGYVATAYFSAIGQKLPSSVVAQQPSDTNSTEALHTRLTQALSKGEKGTSLLLAIHLIQLCAIDYNNAAMQDAFRALVKYGYDNEAKAIVYEMLALEPVI
jgi:hypothetical protein